MAVGNTIRKLRIAKNLSQQFVADHLNVDRRTYASWEEGKGIKSTFIPRLAEFFGKDSTVNTAILILTDKEAINRVLEALKLSDNK